LPPDSLVLAFDTSAAHCAAALLSGDRLLAERYEPMEKGQAERLMPMLAEMLGPDGKPTTIQFGKPTEDGLGASARLAGQEFAVIRISRATSKATRFRGST
jgi:hypothetical protein